MRESEIFFGKIKFIDSMPQRDIYLFNIFRSALNAIFGRTDFFHMPQAPLFYLSIH